MQWNAVASIVHTGNKNKGLWEDKDALMALLGCGKTNVKLACIMLIVTELSEAVENIRHREMPDDKIPEFTGLEAELADAVIRIMDLGERFQLRIGKAIVSKIKYNETRYWRHGGKLA